MTTPQVETPDTDESNLSILTEKIERIHALLKDPHPGLFTWQGALHERMANLVDWWTE